MAHRIGVLSNQLFNYTIRLIFTLALFVLHHAALQVQLLLIEHRKQMAHAVTLRKERIVQHGSRYVLKIVGAIVIGGAVQISSADALKGVEKSSVEVFTAAEHQVLKQVSKANLSRL